MKIFAAILLVVLVLLQARLWLSDEGVREVKRLEKGVAAQQEENATLKARNDRLAAEVKDLKEGMDAVEERARSDLGMVGSNESFYQVVPRDKPVAPDDDGQKPKDPEADSAGDAPGTPQSSKQASTR